jgi:hypothetical protein
MVATHNQTEIDDRIPWGQPVRDLAQLRRQLVVAVGL